MTWQTNLLNNLLVIGILLALFVIIYCKIKKETLGDIFRELKDVGSQ